MESMKFGGAPLETGCCIAKSRLNLPPAAVNSPIKHSGLPHASIDSTTKSFL